MAWKGGIRPASKGGKGDRGTCCEPCGPSASKWRSGEMVSRKKSLRRKDESGGMVGGSG